MVKKNLTRKNLSNKIYQLMGFSKNFSSSFVDNFFENLIEEFTKTNNVKIYSFGTFKVISRKKRIGRNPKTKVKANIASRKVVTFKPSLFIKEKLNK